MTTFNPIAHLEVPVITIKRGETMTVWMRISDHPLQQEQVELRVKRDGTPEIFSRKDLDSSPNLMDFKDWGPDDDR